MVQRALLLAVGIGGTVVLVGLAVMDSLGWLVFEVGAIILIFEGIRARSSSIIMRAS